MLSKIPFNSAADILSSISLDLSPIQTFLARPIAGGKLWLEAVAPTKGDLLILHRMFRICNVGALVFVVLFLVIRLPKFSHIYRLVRFIRLARVIRIVNFIRGLSSTVMSFAKLRRIIRFIRRARTVDLFPLVLAIVVMIFLCSISTLCCNSLYGPRARCFACYALFVSFATFAFLWGCFRKSPTPRSRPPPPRSSTPSATRDTNPPRGSS